MQTNPEEEIQALDGPDRLPVLALCWAMVRAICAWFTGRDTEA